MAKSHDAKRDQLDIAADAQHIHSVRQHCNEQGAKQSGADTAATAAQARAADDRGGDALKHQAPPRLGSRERYARSA